ncbi:MAG: TIGR03960 family B12-binding radical SAM protein [Chloroflexota bacterium]|nr:TIGR03960 family B12-binding radical SAM protein [Chloroflexota bacterium]
MTELDRILPRVTRPARYTGGEWNSIIKDWETTEVKVALCYPDVYEIGMSNLGLSVLYDLVNREPHALAERVFAPWVDMEAELRQASVPLFSLESRRPIADFDIIGFSLGYELTYTNVLTVLDLSGIPLFAAERDRSHPLVIAGGSCALNPEPMAEFVDIFCLGDGEEVLLELIDAYRRWRSAGAGQRDELLRGLAAIRGVYVPSLYRTDHGGDDTPCTVRPAADWVPAVVERRIVEELTPTVTRPIVPFVETVHDRAAIEIQRGCTRGCRFCQAGTIYRPLRERPLEEVMQAADELLHSSGYNELSLVSLSTSDYSEIDTLVGRLTERYRDDCVKLSLPSLHLGSFSTRLMDSFADGKKGGLTFAPEAGSERLRCAVNKVVPEEELLKTLDMAQERGWGSVKLYFMLGLPTETEGDVEDIVRLVRTIHRSRRRQGGRPLRVKVSASPFVPKAHTPFQWVAQDTEEVLGAKVAVVKAGLRGVGVHLSWQDARMSLLEGVLARGDRRLSQVIYRAWQMGSRFEAWSEHFDYDRWLRAFAECGLDPSFYAHRERPLDEALPWGHIDVGVSTSHLKREFLNTKNGAVTEDCRYGHCTACGLQRWHGGCQRLYQNSSSSSS